ncbi:ATP-grasp domain-containing protein [Hamadaea tsunoensis]|uniref:ATP-grasp domain-containing protein n=1 Tax=Hamadaea tsunoensis TaxID=53368 RepID=UPI0003FDB3DA|nr:ATP-grasp domain-containing protein [Hamadaea tsunoensis]
MTTVLVLSNHTDVLEQALLARGHDVIAVMTRPAYQLRHRADDRPPYRVRVVESWQAFEDIARVGNLLRGDVERVATTWEGAVVAAGFLRDLLDLPGMNMHTAVGVTDKAVMKWRLQDAGINVARFRYIRTPADVYEAAAHVGWPMIIKPYKGFGSLGTFSVDTAADLRAAEQRLFHVPLGTSPFFSAEPTVRALADQGGFLIEQDLQPVAEYHIDQLWANGEPLYNAVGLYNIPPLQGMGTSMGSVLLPYGSDEAIRLSGLAQRAVRALAVRDGFTHTEILVDRQGRLYVGEVAARPGGGGIQRLLHHAYGLDVPSLLAQHSAGEPLTVDVEPRPGVFGWIGPYAPDGRIREIATVSRIMRQPGVLEATVVAKPGDSGGMAGSTLWAGAVGTAIVHAGSIEQAFARMTDAADAYGIVVDQTVTVSR